MNALEIIALVVLLVIVGAFIGGVVAARRRAAALAPRLEEHLTEIEQRLAKAQADDPSWRRELLEAEARRALREHRPELAEQPLQLVRVHDAPGIHEDEAEFKVEGASRGAVVHVRVARRKGTWEAQIID